MAVWAYCEASALRIFGDSLGDPVADDILRALRQSGGNGMTRTGPLQFLRSAPSIRPDRSRTATARDERPNPLGSKGDRRSLNRNESEGAAHDPRLPKDPARDEHKSGCLKVDLRARPY
jgi:hypothetical protein